MGRETQLPHSEQKLWAYIDPSSHVLLPTPQVSGSSTVFPIPSHGSQPCLSRYVARSRGDLGLYGDSFDEEGFVDTWLDFCLHEALGLGGFEASGGPTWYVSSS